MRHWLFGLRTWGAMMLALATAFWLQLDGASSAAVTAAILALPTRGQAASKAVFRCVGTVAGVAASILISALFNGSPTLFLVAVAAWLATCVFVANLLDGNRAYAAVLSGYTVALVAVADIDAPNSTFLTGIERGAAIAIGIAAVAVVNDLFGAPDLLPSLLARMRAVHADVRRLALRALEHGSVDPLDAAKLLGRATGLRADALLLPAESVAGRNRAAAARRAIGALVAEARAAHVLGSTLASMGKHGPAWRDDIAAAFTDQAAGDAMLLRAAEAAADEASDPPRLVAARSIEAVVARDRLVVDAMRDMVSGLGPSSGPRLASYHSRHNAARNALRTFLAVLISGAVLVAAGLPSASGSLLFVCVLSGLSANSPDPRKFIAGALVAIPLAAVAAGVTEFVVLDGADAFPLLAIALLPTILAGCLLMSAGKPALFGIGFLLIVFTPALMSLANPQAYNPNTFLNQVLFIALAALLLATAITTVLPTDDARRRRWMLADTRRELFAAADGRRPGRLTHEEASFRSADRLGQLAGLAYGDDRARAATLTHALHLSEMTTSVRQMAGEIDEIDGPSVGEARSAMAALDPARLRAAALRLCRETRCRWAAADAARSAALVERYAADLALARAGHLP